MLALSAGIPRLNTAARLALLVALSAALALLLVAQGGARGARAAQAWQVQVSGANESGSVMAQGFFPSPLTVNVGDSVEWKWAITPAPHTVTFLGGNPPLPDVGPGTEPGELLLGAANFPAGPQGPDASYPVDGVVSSGTPPGPPEEFGYLLTFTEPGVYPYVCSIHPGTVGQIVVVAADSALPETPEQAWTRGQTAVANLISNMEGAVAFVRSASAEDTHTVAAGMGQGFGVTALQFLPAEITVEQGERVAWVVADPFEIHTVTFTSGGETPPFVDVRFQTDGPPQLAVVADVAGPVGGSVYDGTGYLNSGILTPGNGFVVTVDAPAGRYEYVCIVHPDMKGWITVEE